LEIFINGGTIKAREKLFCILLSGVYRQTVINTAGKNATKVNGYGYRICLCTFPGRGIYIAMRNVLYGKISRYMALVRYAKQWSDKLPLLPDKLPEQVSLNALNQQSPMMNRFSI